MHTILRCTKVEFLGTKDGKERVFATVSMDNGKLVVDTDDEGFKEKFLTLVAKNKDQGFPLYWSREEDGWHQDMVSFQKLGDPLFLEALIGPWHTGVKVVDEQMGTYWGYQNIWARRAGKVWEEEVPEDML